MNMLFPLFLYSNLVIFHKGFSQNDLYQTMMNNSALAFIVSFFGLMALIIKDYYWYTYNFKINMCIDYMKFFESTDYT